MELEAASAQVDGSQPSLFLPFPRAVWWRVLYGVYIVVLPALAFWTNSVWGPEWQSGEFADYIKLLLFPEASLLFFVLLAYSILCYLFLLSAPAQGTRLFFIRFGIYTGTFLALQYSILSVPVLFNTGLKTLFLVIWILPLVVWGIYRWMAARWVASGVNHVLSMLVIAVLVIGILLRGGVGLILLVFIPSAPFWSLLIALRATIWLLKNYETRFSLPRGFGLASWLAVYAVAWRYDILKMYELYAALPKQPPPDCYIATAAARGHPQVVQSWSVPGTQGTSRRVNAQLQRLKCAELALLAIHPHLHQSLRRIYDGLGKPLARRIQNPFLADLAYFLLKPCEWSAVFLLKRVIPEIDSISRKMYV